MKHQKMTAMIDYCWKCMIEDDVPPGHPLRRASVTIREFEDRTFEHEGIMHVVDIEPFVYFVIKTEKVNDALPLTEGAGLYQIDTVMLPGGEKSYPIKAGLYELCINGKPAYNRKTKTFHHLLEMS